MTTLDLFAALEPPEDRRCGTCVVRNAIREADEFGGCSRTGALQHRDAKACADWFGLTELRQPLYGKK